MTTKQELQELLQEVEQWKEADTPLSEASIKYAIAFVENSKLVQDSFTPDITVHWDGEVSLRWFVPYTAILEIAFNEEGWATWVGYLIAPKRNVSKGRFQVSGTLEIEGIDLAIFGSKSTQNTQ